MKNGGAAPWSAAAFEARYARKNDPWNFATSIYEQFRYSSIIKILSKTAYGAAFEPGCSIGELTYRLSLRCRSVHATEVAPTAVDIARKKCGHRQNVRIDCAQLSAENVPSGPFDLIVFSEIGYYFSDIELTQIARRASATLCEGAEFIAAHWLGRSADHQLHGDDVHRNLNESLSLQPLKSERYPSFRIDSWIRL